MFEYNRSIQITLNNNDKRHKLVQTEEKNGQKKGFIISMWLIQYTQLYNITHTPNKLCWII